MCHQGAVFRCVRYDIPLLWKPHWSHEVTPRCLGMNSAVAGLAWSGLDFIFSSIDPPHPTSLFSLLYIHPPTPRLLPCPLSPPLPPLSVTPHCPLASLYYSWLPSSLVTPALQGLRAARVLTGNTGPHTLAVVTRRGQPVTCPQHHGANTQMSQIHCVWITVRA